MLGKVGVANLSSDYHERCSPAHLEDKLAHVRRELQEIGAAVVAYSGGVDSSLVAYLAHDVLEQHSLAVTAASPAVPREEVEQATQIASSNGWRHRVIHTHELNDPRYVENTGQRCFFCKTELYSALAKIAQEEGGSTIVNGANTDDTHDYRPGMSAATEFGVRSPLVEANISKQEVRTLAKQLNLSTWNKPAQPCLASRIPYNTQVSAQALAMVEQAERALHKIGFRDFRVRHHPPIARIEIQDEQFSILHDAITRRQIETVVKAAGYRYVTVALNSFASGNLNHALESVAKR